MSRVTVTAPVQDSTISNGEITFVFYYTNAAGDPCTECRIGLGPMTLNMDAAAVQAQMIADGTVTVTAKLTPRAPDGTQWSERWSSNVASMSGTYPTEGVHTALVFCKFQSTQQFGAFVPNLTVEQSSTTFLSPSDDVSANYGTVLDFAWRNTFDPDDDTEVILYVGDPDAKEHLAFRTAAAVDGAVETRLSTDGVLASGTYAVYVDYTYDGNVLRTRADHTVMYTVYPPTILSPYGSVWKPIRMRYTLSSGYSYTDAEYVWRTAEDERSQKILAEPGTYTVIVPMAPGTYETFIRFTTTAIQGVYEGPRHTIDVLVAPPRAAEDTVEALDIGVSLTVGLVLGAAVAIVLCVHAGIIKVR